MATPLACELELAEIAHRLWCQRMIAAGWTPGTRFDERARTHDAIVRFPELTAVDRRNTALGVVASDLASTLQTIADYPRGADREFCESEMHVGMRVGSADDPTQFGTVIGWTLDADWPGCLTLIAVEWDSGERVDHVAAERELRRLE